MWTAPPNSINTYTLTPPEGLLAATPTRASVRVGQEAGNSYVANEIAASHVKHDPYASQTRQSASAASSASSFSPHSSSASQPSSSDVVSPHSRSPSNSAYPALQEDVKPAHLVRNPSLSHLSPPMSSDSPSLVSAIAIGQSLGSQSAADSPLVSVRSPSACSVSSPGSVGYSSPMFPPSSSRHVKTGQ